MEKTNGELKDELLIVYRLHFAVLYERERQRLAVSRLKKQLKEAEREAEDERDIAQNLRERNRELNEEFTDVIMDTYRFKEALDSTLDLVGEVIIHEAKMDHLYGLIDVAYIVEPSEDAWAAPAAVVLGLMEERADGGPARCMSCGEPKVDDNHFFICEDCFDLDVENDFNLFGPMMTAWDKGERDFPRPGFNAKEMLVSEGKGER